jgi:hypothetical protein
LEVIFQADGLPNPQQLEGLGRINFWQRLYQIWLLAFGVVAFDNRHVRHQVGRWPLIGDGNINFSIILGACSASR